MTGRFGGALSHMSRIRASSGGGRSAFRGGRAPFTTAATDTAREKMSAGYEWTSGGRYPPRSKGSEC
jgi:hypothetical protein